MSKYNFRDIIKFKDDDKIEVEKYVNGGVFPFNPAEITNYNDGDHIICFTSLSCKNCIEILPELLPISNNMEYSRKFVLIVEGNKEDEIQIQEYFKFNFSVKAMSRSEYEFLDVKSTPALIIIDKKQRIKNKVKVPSATDILEYLEKAE